jgi:hypothetical protein
MKIYALQMSYDTSDDEKQQAEKALICFDYALKALRQAIDYLDLLGTPFKDHPDIPENEIIKYRVDLRTYRDNMIDKFNSFKRIAFQCVNQLDVFRLDTQTAKLIKSFISSIDSIEDKVNTLSKLFDNLQSSTLVSDVNTNVAELHKLTDELEEIIDDRIKGHIKGNIIGKTWLDNLRNEMKLEVNKKDPLLVELMKDEQKQVQGK